MGFRGSRNARKARNEAEVVLVAPVAIVREKLRCARGERCERKLMMAWRSLREAKAKPGLNRQIAWEREGRAHERG